MIREQAFNESAELPRYLNATVQIGNVGRTLQSQIKVGRYNWIVAATDDSLLVSAQNPEAIKQSLKSRLELEGATLHALAYARTAATFALETPAKRSFRSSILNSTEDELNWNEQPGEYSLRDDQLALRKQLLDDVGRAYRVNHHRLLEYWRRGFELSLLGYTTEAYLNYYKILESLLKGSPEGPIFQQVKSKYQNTLKGLRRFNQAGVHPDNIRNSVARLAQALNHSGLTRNEFVQLADLLLVRHNENIAHKKSFSHHGYRFAGYGDDFEVDAFLLDDIKELSRLFILGKLGLRNYWLDLGGGVYRLQVTPRSAIK